MRGLLPRTAQRGALAAFALTVLLALAGGCGNASPGRALALPPTGALPVSRSSHIVTIVMENAEYSEVINSAAAPYVNALARRYGLAQESYAVGHPSLPNYLALTSGSTHAISSDCTESVSYTHLTLPTNREV